MDRNPSPPAGESDSPAHCSDGAAHTAHSLHVGDTALACSTVYETMLMLLREAESAPRHSGDTCAELEAELETALCTIWDATADTQVCAFLLNTDNFVSVCDRALDATNKPRLAEILLGVWHNVSCDDGCRERLFADPVALANVVKFVACRDAPTLVQVYRIVGNVLSAGEWDDRWEHAFTVESCADDILFVLQSTNNDDLFCAAASAADSLFTASREWRRRLSLPAQQAVVGAAVRRSVAFVEGGGDGPQAAGWPNDSPAPCEHLCRLMHSLVADCADKAGSPCAFDWAVPTCSGVLRAVALVDAADLMIAHCVVVRCVLSTLLLCPLEDGHATDGAELLSVCRGACDRLDDIENESEYALENRAAVQCDMQLIDAMLAGRTNSDG